jgi:hypothetical protein
MFATNYKINISTLPTGTTATTINIPVNLEYQLIDNSELINTVFVDVETKKAINPIVDFEKARFLPSYEGNQIVKIIYNININGDINYLDDSFGFDSDDLKYSRENFKQSYLSLNFYDSPDPLTQAFSSNIVIYSRKTIDNKVSFILENPLINPKGVFEGFHIYDYKSDFSFNENKYLYMKASFVNVKIGKTTNLMVKQNALPITELQSELYTRYKLFRTTNGFYYTIDDEYQGFNQTLNQNNVSYINNQAIINLYNIKTL